MHSLLLRHGLGRLLPLPELPRPPTEVWRLLLSRPWLGPFVLAPSPSWTASIGPTLCLDTAAFVAVVTLHIALLLLGVGIGSFDLGPILDVPFGNVLLGRFSLGQVNI